jgi:hypothetical protein
MSGSTSDRSRTEAAATSSAIAAPAAAVVERERHPVPVRLRRGQRGAGQPEAGRQRCVEVHHQAAAGTVPGVQRLDRAVVHHPAVVDHHQPPAQPLDVGQVVRGRCPPG